MFAGESMLGSFNIEITEIRIASTPKIGLQRSSAVSCVLKLSVPGGCRIEMQTLPSGYTEPGHLKTYLLFGCHILLMNLISGGLFG